MSSPLTRHRSLLLKLKQNSYLQLEDTLELFQTRVVRGAFPILCEGGLVDVLRQTKSSEIPVFVLKKSETRSSGVFF